MAHRVIVIVFGCGLWLLAWGQSSLAAEKPKLAFVRGGNIWIADSDGTNSRQLTFSLRDGSPAVSPDGKWVAYSSWLVEGSDFGQTFMIPAAGGMVRQFRHPEVQGAVEPCFSPDGKQLLFRGFSDFQEGKSRGSEHGFATISLCLADLTTGTLRRILSQPKTNLDPGHIYINPAFSGDGRLIAYERSTNGFSVGFLVIDLQGKKIFRFPKDSRDTNTYLRPQFSSDGKEILCWCPHVDKYRDVIYLVNLATGEQTSLALGSNPTYVDHGQAIVYQKWPKPVIEGHGPDLWRLELKPGASPKMIIDNATEPAGQMP